MIILIILCIIIIFFIIKKFIYKESFVIDSTNPNNNLVNVKLLDSESLVNNYNSYFDFDGLIGNVVKDNTYYNTLMYKNSNIDFNKLNDYFNDKNNAYTDLNTMIDNFNKNTVVELNNRLKNTSLNYVWKTDNNVNVINNNLADLIKLLKLQFPEYIQNNPTYNYTNNLWYYNNVLNDLNVKSSIANTIILGFDNINTSTMTSSSNTDKLNYIKDRLNNYGYLPGTGQAFKTILSYITNATPKMPTDKYEFLQNYSNYSITKKPEYDNYFQTQFIPSMASEFITTYSNTITSFNQKALLMTKTYIQYVYDYTTNEVQTAVNNINNANDVYNSKIKLYETTLQDYQNSSSSAIEANNKYIMNKNNLNNSYLKSVTNVINDQHNDLNNKLKDALSQQWTFDDAAAQKAVTKNVINATQSLKNQIQASNELSDLINKQQSMIYDDVYSKDQNSKLFDSQNQFLSLDTFRTGIMHRYKDPSCNEENSYVYCEGGEIECQDVFGNVMPDLMKVEKSNDYAYGNTYSKCGSVLSKMELKDISRDMSGVILPGNIGFYYDISGTTCPANKPWAVGGSDYVVPFDSCYETEEDASNRLNMIRNYNTTDLTNDAIVYIDGDYLMNEYLSNNPEAKVILNKQKTMWINNKRSFKGVIDKLDTNNLFNVYIPNKDGVLFKGIAGKYMSTLNTDYITNKSKYLGNLKNGDLPRPVCKGGRFTEKCGQKPPYNPKTGEPYEIDPNNKVPIESNVTDDKKQPIVTSLTPFNINDVNEYQPSVLNSTVGYSSY